MMPTLAAVALAALATLTPAPASAQEVRTAPVAVLRGLDRLSGELTEFEVPVDQQRDYGELEVTVKECRYPADNPAGDAFAYLVIRDKRVADPVFEGWMVASSPALNALDHMRYDVWVMRCKSS